MELTTAEIAVAVGGEVIGEDVAVEGASIDSRTLVAGNLFVPIVAERNGHAFIDSALEAGAAAYLTAEAPRGATAVVVGDTLEALGRIGAMARSRLPEPVIGITGSVGKTTTKDMLAEMLRRSGPVAASDRSFNNEMGVPLTLVNAPNDARSAVVEMGARGVGHIASLCDIARPTIGVVTVIALAHAELFGDLTTIAKAKGELIEALPARGTAVLNADDPMVSPMADITDADVVTFGRHADVSVTSVAVDDVLRVSLELTSPWGIVRATLGARGEHQVTNAAAAATAALAGGVTLDDVVAGLETEPGSAWRMQLLETAGGAHVLNDAYNANRTSTEAALRSLAALGRPRQTAVLGLMAELGDQAPAEHAAVAALAEQLGVRIIAYGTDLYGVEPLSSIDEAVAALGVLDEQDAVLVKGSRMNELENLVDLIS